MSYPNYGYNGYMYYNPPRPSYSGFNWIRQGYCDIPTDDRGQPMYYQNIRAPNAQRPSGSLLPFPQPGVSQPQPAQPAARVQPPQPTARVQPPQPTARVQPPQPTARVQPSVVPTPAPSNTTSASQRSTTQSNEIDLSKFIPNLRNTGSLSKNEKKKHRKEYQEKIHKLSLEQLTKIKNKMQSIITEMGDEKKRKQQEISLLESSITQSQVYISDVSNAIRAANVKIAQQHISAVNSMAERVAKRTLDVDHRNNRSNRENNQNNQSERNNQSQLPPQVQPQQQKNVPNGNERKRYRIDSPPRNNNTNISNIGPTLEDFRAFATIVESHLTRSRNYISKTTQHIKETTPPNTVQSTSVTSSHSPLAPYPVDGGETHIKFANFLLKFSVKTVVLKAKRYDVRYTTKCVIDFSLTLEEHQLLKEYKSDKNNINNNHRLILRMSKPNSTQREYYDYIDTNIKIKVNGKTPLFPGEKKHNNNSNQPKPKRQRYIEAPLDISDECTDSDDVIITLEVDSGNDTEVIIGIYFVRILSFSESIRAFNEFRQLRNAECGLNAIDRLLNNPDSGFLDETLPVPLTCPISKQRIGIPCLGVNCVHYNCFDLMAFLQIHATKFLWKCPICDKVINSGHILLDGLFYELLKKTKDSCLKVTFYNNGKWVPTSPEQKAAEDIDSTADILLLSDDES